MKKDSLLIIELKRNSNNDGDRIYEQIKKRTDEKLKNWGETKEKWSERKKEWA